MALNLNTLGLLAGQACFCMPRYLLQSAIHSPTGKSMTFSRLSLSISSQTAKMKTGKGDTGWNYAQARYFVSQDGMSTLPQAVHLFQSLLVGFSRDRGVFHAGILPASDTPSEIPDYL